MPPIDYGSTEEHRFTARHARRRAFDEVIAALDRKIDFYRGCDMIGESNGLAMARDLIAAARDGEEHV